MTLNKINLAIPTVWRERDYLAATLDSLLVEYPQNVQQPIYLVVGSPVTTHVDRYKSQPGISVVEMGPNTWSWIKDRYTHHRATWNYYRCLTQPIAGTRGTLILEDDVRFARGWSARLEATLAALEGKHGSSFVLAVYAAWFSALKVRHPGQIYVEYPPRHFCGTQGIYYPVGVRQGFARYLKVHGVVANEDHYDKILRRYLIESDIPLFATTPCLIQHMGKTSAIETPWHESKDFMEDVTAEPVGQDE